MKKENRDKNKGLTVSLICVGLFLLAFTASMEIMYYIVGSVPTELVTGVFGACSGEGLFCMLIYLFKKPKKPTDCDCDYDYNNYNNYNNYNECEEE